MNHRRHAAGAAALALCIGSTVLSPETATAQTYPSRPVRIVAGFGPGDPNDIIARLVGQWLSDRLGQPFVVENRPGAGSNLATEAVIRSPADGYTLVMVAASAAINATLYNNLKFNFISDVAPVAGIIRQPQLMVVTPSVPATTVREFIDFAKANPGKVNYASPGIGTAPHVAGELFKMLSGVSMPHVVYRGAAPALTDLLSGQVQVMFTAAAGEHVKSGKLRALAVTTTARLDTLPHVPTVKDSVPGFDSSTWFGVGAPKDTPQPVIEKLNIEINNGLANPKLRQQLIDMGGVIISGAPADFGRLIADETERWAKVVKFSGAKVE